jgi:hypothetical protein
VGTARATARNRREAERAANAAIKVPEIAAKFAALDLVLVGSTLEELVRSQPR